MINGSSRTEQGLDAPILAPQQNEAPEEYVERLKKDVYKDEFQGKLLDAFIVFASISRVGMSHLEHHNELPLEPALQLFTQPSLVAAHAGFNEAVRAGEDVVRDYRWEAEMQLQPDAANSAIIALNTLAFFVRREGEQERVEWLARLRRTRQWSIGRIEARLKAALLRRPDLEEAYHVREEEKATQGVHFEKEVYGGQLKQVVRTIGVSRRVKLADLEHAAIMTSVLFENYGIGEGIMPNTLDLIDQNYKLELPHGA